MSDLVEKRGEARGIKVGEERGELAARKNGHRETLCIMFMC